MYLPKQASPVPRMLSTTSQLNQHGGVDPSITLQDIEDFRRGLRIGGGIVTDLLAPIPNILQILGPLAGLL